MTLIALAPLVALSVVGAASWLRYGELERLHKARDRSFQAIVAVHQLQSRIKDTESALRAYLLTGEAAFAGRYREGLDAWRHELETLERAVPEAAPTRPQVLASQTALEDWTRRSEALMAARQSGETPPEAHEPAPLLPEALMQGSQTLLESERARRLALIAEGDRLNRESRWMLGSAAVLTSLWAAAAALLLLRRRVSALQAEKDDLERLYAVSRVLVSEPDWQVSTRRALEELQRVMRLERAALFLYAEEANEMRLVAESGKASEFVRALDVVPVHDESPLLVGHIGLARRVMSMADARQIASLAPVLGVMDQLGERGLLGVPALAGDRLVGALVLRRREPFSEREAATAELIGHHLAFALENARAFQALQELTRMKSDLQANVSHELRTPLTAIQGAAGLLAMGTSATPEQQRFIEMIDVNARRLGSVIQDLLDLSQLDDGTLRLQVRAVDLAPLLADTLQRQQAAAEARSITLSGESGPSVWVLADPCRVVQVVRQLIENGIKFTPPRGAVHLSVVQDERTVTVRVSDTGPGLGPEAQRMLFEPFYRPDPALTRGTSGTGVGLAIAQRIVKAHGGTIELVCPPQGGCVFSFTLPRSAEGAPALEAAPPVEA